MGAAQGPAAPRAAPTPRRCRTNARNSNEHAIAGRRLAGLAAALLLAGCANIDGHRAAGHAARAPPGPARRRTAGARCRAAMVARVRRRRSSTPWSTRPCATTPTSAWRRPACAARRRRPNAADAATLPAGERRAGRRRASATPRHGLCPPPLAGSIQNTGTLQAQRQLGDRLLRQEPGRAGSRARRARAPPRPTSHAARVVLASQRGAHLLPAGARCRTSWRVARRTLAQREEQLQLVRDRVSAGLDTTLELRQSEGALPEARQQIEALQEQAQLTRNALAALVGQPDVPAVGALPALRRLQPGTAVPAPCRPTCWAAAPTSPPRAGASKPPTQDIDEREGAVLSQHQPGRLRRPVQHRPGPACSTSAARSGASARRSACRSSMPAACAPTCAARPPTSTPPSRATTPPCSTRSAKRPTSSRQPAVASRASRREQRQAAGGRRRRLRHRRAALPRRPRHLPERADRRDHRAEPAPPGRRPGRPRARHAASPCIAPSAAATATPTPTASPRH